MNVGLHIGHTLRIARRISGEVLHSSDAIHPGDLWSVVDITLQEIYILVFLGGSLKSGCNSMTWPTPIQQNKYRAIRMHLATYHVA